MSKVVKYKQAWNFDPDSLQELVNVYLQGGWFLYGPSFCGTKDKPPIFIQPMVQYED